MSRLWMRGTSKSDVFLHFSPRVPSARVEWASSLVTEKLETMVEVPSVHTTLWSKHKAISTLFPYAIRLEQGGQQEMVDAILLAAKVSVRILEWPQLWVHISPVFDGCSPPSLNRVIALFFPYIPWYYNCPDPGNSVSRWVAAASAIRYSEEAGPSVVNALLRISASESLRSHIPADIWAWLEQRPSLPPVCIGRLVGSWRSIIRHVRGLGDIEILKSYLLLVWSEWDSLSSPDEMEVLIREDFGGIGMWYHRDDLVKHLNHVQEQLDRGLEHFKQHKPRTKESSIHERKEQYEQLKNVLLEVDKGATETLTRTIPKLIILISVLIVAIVFRIPPDFHLCSASSVPVTSDLERSPLISRVSNTPCSSGLY